MKLALHSDLLGTLAVVARLPGLRSWPEPVKRWTVWIDGAAEPACRFSLRHEAERALLQFPDHGYMYIESPSGSQYAWNPFRASWELIGEALP
jgi:hypothetical protein